MVLSPFKRASRHPQALSWPPYPQRATQINATLDHAVPRRRNAGPRALARRL